VRRCGTHDGRWSPRVPGNRRDLLQQQPQTPDLPYLPEWCGAPPIAFHIVLRSTLIGPWLVATYLLARGEAIVQFDRGYTYGWFAFVFMGLMWWLGFLAFFVLLSIGKERANVPGFWSSPLSAGRLQCR
jgi:hypothetical protein